MYLDYEWFHMVAGVPKCLSLHLKDECGPCVVEKLSTKIPEKNSLVAHCVRVLD
jgi:hypothetical protein